MSSLAALLPESPAPYMALMLLGFFVGVAGHVYKSRIAVAVGIALIFIATLLLPLVILATQDDPGRPSDIYAPGTR